MKKLKALRNKTVDRSLKSSFGITLGVENLKAKCIGIIDSTNERIYGYEVFYPNKTVLVTVSMRNGHVIGSSNSISNHVIEELRASNIVSEEFFVPNGDWSNIVPTLEHEDKLEVK